MHTYMHDSRAPVTADTSQSDHVSAVQGKMHFSELMTGMINLDDAPNSIKLVGPSINCEGTVRLPGGLQRSNPHVQSFALATDRTGALPLLPPVVSCQCNPQFPGAAHHRTLW